MCCPQPGPSRYLLVKAGHFPTRSSCPVERDPCLQASGAQMFVCSLGSCAQNKCQGKSEEKHFHPFIIISRHRCRTHRFLLTRDAAASHSLGAHCGVRQGGPVSSCPSNVLGLKRSQVSLLPQPFFCITPAKPFSNRLSTCSGVGNWGTNRTWPL